MADNDTSKDSGLIGGALAIGWLILLGAGLLVVFLHGSSVEGPHLQYISIGLLTAGAAMVTGAFLGSCSGSPASSRQERLAYKTS